MSFALLMLACGIRPVECPNPPDDITHVLESALAGRSGECEQSSLRLWIDRRATTHGPWRQDIGVARSVDGRQWNAIVDGEGHPRVVVPTAAVPEVVEDKSGKIWLFYVDGDLERLSTGAAAGERSFARRGLPGIGALGAAVSTDGVNFTKVAEVEIKDLGVGMFADPEVVPLADGRWRMYYLAMSVREYTRDAKWVPGEKHEIHSAVSSDLVSWQSEGAVVRGPFADPSVVCFDNHGCTMFSYGLDRSYSLDGKRFEYRGPFGEARGFAPEVFSENAEIARLFYNSAAVGAPLRALLTLDSGETWGAEPVSLDIYGEAVTVLRRGDGSWWLYFHTFKPGTRLPEVKDPEPSAPGSSAPGSSTPGSSAPGSSAPGSSAPGSSAPGSSAAGP